MDPEHARELLARERERIEEELRNLAPEPDDDPEDFPGRAAELVEVELDLALIEALQEELEAVERAEQRLANGTFGLSVESGQPIPDERLEALPTAERTVEEQLRFEGRR
jgi:RNA polymerase-binding transcription factor